MITSGAGRRDRAGVWRPSVSDRGSHRKLDVAPSVMGEKLANRGDDTHLLSGRHADEQR